MPGPGVFRPSRLCRLRNCSKEACIYSEGRRSPAIGLSGEKGEHTALLTTGLQSISLALKTREIGCTLRGGTDMENTTPAMRLGGVQPIPIADVRDIPLDQLAADADCGHLVRRVMRTHGSPSRIDVAAFQSAI